MLRTEGPTDGRKDKNKTSYPPHTQFAGGINIITVIINDVYPNEKHIWIYRIEVLERY